jgi:hypothetical protein
MPAVQIGQTAPLTISLRLAGSAHRNRVGSAQRYASDEQARNTTQESEIPTNKKAGIRTWARFSPKDGRPEGDGYSKIRWTENQQ